ARVGAELAAVNQFLRSAASAPGGSRALSGELEVEPGYELALSAALDTRLSAALAEDMDSGVKLLDRNSRDGVRVIVLRTSADGPGTGEPSNVVPLRRAGETDPPFHNARRLLDLVKGPDDAVAAAARLLHDTWVVETLDGLDDFGGIAVTVEGRAWNGHTRELRRVATGGAERVLAERNRRDKLVAESQAAVTAEHEARKSVEAVFQAVSDADAARDAADRARRDADRARSQAQEEERQAAWLIAQRRRQPEQGAAAVRRAQIQGELQAEARVAERAARERAERARRIEILSAQLAAEQAVQPTAQRLVDVLAGLSAAAATKLEGLEAELAADRAEGEGVANELRSCAREEADVQGKLRQAGEAVTQCEVRAQQARDQAHEADTELSALAEKLELPAEPSTEALPPEEVAALRQRIEKLAKRREQLGPVNPLAMQEYEDALAHVEELETQRTDLETALRELKQVIRDTDRTIRETFEETFNAAAKNFEELAGQLFPGGRGRLRLVADDSGPKPVLGGAAPSEEEAVRAEAAAEDAADAEEQSPDDDLMGVEIEITPAGKSMKRLTLLSGGEKSMTAIAFLFSVFLAKPCPFYILDEVEAALDDANIGRFLTLIEQYADRAQFIVVTHQKRTMEAADTLYGVSMGDDGVSKVVSRKLPREGGARTVEAA
ncbi:MAG TPA: hypothetical protein VN238_05465, partial [Solirubrobacteraceae bacterium]|nr:hypothetical protein [Solirubrobacteraceae bacterium]